MKNVTILLVLGGLAIGVGSGWAGERAGAKAPQMASARVPLTPVPRDGISALNHHVNTKNADAQRHFNDGLTLCYAFNHDEAIRSFKKALVADPNLAMAHWGIAYALG